MRPGFSNMRRVFGVATAILLCCCSSASAVGIDLNWNNCLFSAANRTTDKSFLCDDNAAGPFQLFGSLRPGMTIANVTSWTADLDIDLTPGFAGDWWQLGTAGCREGAITFKFLPADMPNLTSCNKGLMGADVSTSSAAYIDFNARQHRYEISATRTTGVTLIGTTKYQLFRVDVLAVQTTPDPAHPETPACAGCTSPGCIFFSRLELHLPPSSQFPNGTIVFANPEIANFVTWQTGAGLFCYPVATKRSTWGEIKSLYR